MSNPLWSELNRQIGLYTPKIISSVLVLALFWFLSVLLRNVMDRLIARSEEAKRDIYLLVGKTAKAVLWTLGVITALGTLGINVAALVAGLGLTGFALGFALRDAISNLLAGVMIMLYRPFRRRDRILVTGFEGVVAEMNLRYTVLEAEQRTYLVPNSLLLNNPIIVLKPTQKTV